MAKGSPRRKGTLRPQTRPASPSKLNGEAAELTVVGIGASAGGLDACRKFLAALPADNGMAFILVQHLDPTHESMMVDLLDGYTAMTVRLVADGMAIEHDHLYVIPPGYYLSVEGGVLHLLPPQEPHGSRLPFDYLLNSLAASYGGRAIGVVLSGTGADGSSGLRALHEQSGLVIAQDSNEATYDGMPRSAILTGVVDFILPLADIPAALIRYNRQIGLLNSRDDMPESVAAEGWLTDVVNLLRTRTPHDFTLYKPGTLQRRIERRIAMAAVDGDADRYLQLLHNDADQLDRLVRDLLINVTGFFRDPVVFTFLADKIIPELVASQDPAHPLRIWTPGCSSGEESYSLAMLFFEEMAATGRRIKLQIFASDVDAEAIAQAREGRYPETIEADVTPARLSRFFSRDDQGYRVVTELREAVVFTVQDLLADPPFSRLDLISCRNLLIYLKPEAQEKVVSIFHFALRKDGILLLGGAENLGNDDDRFAVISKPHRLYRHISAGLPGEVRFPVNLGNAVHPLARFERGGTVSRPTALAEHCRQLVIETFAPATILINRMHECLFSLGPTDRYLQVVSGQPTQDLLAMTRQGVRTRLRSAIRQAIAENTRIVVPGNRIGQGDKSAYFSISVQPSSWNGEDLLLVSFIDQPDPEQVSARPALVDGTPKGDELERELTETRAELEDAIRDLELANQELQAINEESLSANEEFQSTNEELLTSKEELQSLNEELTALNSQLQETLELQRTTSRDLENFLYSTDVATLFLDADLNIRFYTPAIKNLYRLVPTDVGRPIADFDSMTEDGTLLSDARQVLQGGAHVEREIKTRNGDWYLRRILPYRGPDDRTDGVVITFVDTSEQKHASEAMEAARREAERANAAKTRFLAAASHDLRQPLQTLALLQGILSRTVKGERVQHLAGQIDATIGAMSGMLNALLDINQIEAGTIHAEKTDFPINDLLKRLADEFRYHAQSKGLAFRMVPCSLTVHSDPRLLEQMIRNLLSNALKYTETGKILLGCRRQGTTLRIDICDTGIGIPGSELKAIFEEYHQVDNAARESSRGLGLGLAIVQRLGDLLGHTLGAQSLPSKGSVFSIDIALRSTEGEAAPARRRDGADGGPAPMVSAASRTILVVEDDPGVRNLLQVLLESEGYRIITAGDSVIASNLPLLGVDRPDLIIADYNLPNGVTGLQCAIRVRETLDDEIPVIILTGDISTGTLQEIARQDCLLLNKPIKGMALLRNVQELLAAYRPRAHSPSRPAQRGREADGAAISVIDDDSSVREAIRDLLELEGHKVETYASSEAFLAAYRPGGVACLLIDARLPGMQGVELLQHLHDAGDLTPAILITGGGDVAMAVHAMKAGAVDFIEKPVSRDDLLASLGQALARLQDAATLSARRANAARMIANLTERQRQIMDLVLAGHPNKNIAADLGISRRTVEIHRANVMKKTGAKSLPELARLAIAAAEFDGDGTA